VSALSKYLPWNLAQTRWAQQLDPLLANPLNNASILPNVSLTTGVNIINTKLGQLQQGWFLVDVQGVASIYRSAPFNSTTLTLTSSADVVVSLAVF
jgi:hypothetical protein